MSFGYFEILGVVADGLQMLLIALILFLLVRYRKRTPTSDRSDWASSEANPFRHEFLVQSLKYQTELAFDRIEKTIQTERLNLRQLYESDPPQSDPDGMDAAEKLLDTTPFNIDQTPLTDQQDDDHSPYREVLQLAADGVNPHRIAKQLSIPRGEVDLVLKMSASPSLAGIGNDPELPTASRRATR